MNSEEEVIRQALLEANRDIFLPKAVQVKLLSECAFALPTLVDWLYDDWHSYDVTLTKERLKPGLQAQLANNRMPFTLVALKNGLPVGSISLKREGPAEFTNFEGPWPGSFHVIPQERQRRLGWHLANLILLIAKRLGFTHAYFYTSNARNVERYKKVFGAQVIKICPFRGHEVTLMSITFTRLGL